MAGNTPTDTNDEDRPGTLQAFRPGCTPAENHQSYLLDLGETADLARRTSDQGKHLQSRYLKASRGGLRTRCFKFIYSQFKTRYVVDLAICVPKSYR